MTALDFTLNGRLRPQPGVTEAKVQAVQMLLEGALKGSHEALGRLKEVLSSSDAIFAYAHLENVNFLPQFDEADRTWTQIAGTYKVSDFRQPTLWALTADWDGLPSGDVVPGIAPSIAEGGAYPYAYMRGEEAGTGKIGKRGFKTDFTFEAFINDALGFLAALPGNMLDVALDTEEYEVYNALKNGVGDSQQLKAGTVRETDADVVVNSKISRDAIALALSQLKARKINNRRVRVSTTNLLVPLEQEDYVNWILSQTLLQIDNGTLVFGAGGYNPFSGIKVIGTEWMEDEEWFLLPTPGTTRRRVLDRGLLLGHESPELRVEDVTGTYVGGGQISPFEGSFNNDSTTFRLRQIGGGILWTPDLVIWSDGTEA